MSGFTSPPPPPPGPPGGPPSQPPPGGFQPPPPGGFPPPQPGGAGPGPVVGGAAPVGPSGGLSTKVVGLIAAGSLVAGLVIGGVGGAVLFGGDDGGSASESASRSVDRQESRRSEDPEPTSTTTTERSSTTAPPTTSVRSRDEGTRENPFPAGTALESTDGIGVVVQSVDLNADAIVAGENSFNDPPAPGNRFVLVNVRVINGSDEPVIPYFIVDVEAIGSGNQVRSDSFNVIPDPLIYAPEIYPGGEASGNVLIEVPITELDDGSLLLRISVNYGDPVFVRPV